MSKDSNVSNGHANGHTNGHANGLANGHANGHAAEGSFDDEDSTMNVKPMQPLLQGYHRTGRGLVVPQGGQHPGPQPGKQQQKYPGYKMEHKRASGETDAEDMSSGKFGGLLPLSLCDASSSAGYRRVPATHGCATGCLSAPGTARALPRA